MTLRERIFKRLNFENTDRLPAVHFGYWPELLVEWAEQGHISMDLAKSVDDSNAADRELNKMLGWEFNWQSVFSGNTGLCPQFEYKVIETLPDGFIRYQDGNGLIQRKREGAASIPAEDDYLLKDREAFETLYKDKMSYKPERIDADFVKKYFSERDESYPIAIHLGSVMGSIRDMLSVIGMSYMMYDDFDLLKEIVDTYADMQYKCAEELLKTGVKFDYAHYWEDVCFKNGPLLAPDMFEELTAKHYKKRNELCKQYGIDIISLDCDGVTESLVKVWYENGVNTMFPIEVGVWGGNLKTLRDKCGPELKGVGGMDKTVLRKDKKAVDEEIERLRPLIDEGGYLPCPDHRLMPGTKWELVQYYTDKIKNLKI